MVDWSGGHDGWMDGFMHNLSKCGGIPGVNCGPKVEVSLLTCEMLEGFRLAAIDV
jgi:hypothetical protein